MALDRLQPQPGDPALLVVATGPYAGDKAGNWEGWYRTAIPLADQRFTEHLIELEAGER